MNRPVRVWRMGLAALALSALALPNATAQGRVSFGETKVVVDTGIERIPLRVMFARRPAQLAQGLMFRSTIKPFDGMLFDMGVVQQGSFWMRNTLIPLDIIFVTADGLVDSIGRGVPLSLAPVMSKGKIRGVLELRHGRAKALGIRVGTIIRHKIFGNAP
jgi:uncharacterized membrane protein (UPF0127 family)